MNEKQKIKHIYNIRKSKVKEQILWTFRIVETIQIVPAEYEYLKHIEGTDGLYEIRIQSGSNIFGIFCFFDDKNLVVVGNVFQKIEKTPKLKIDIALGIK
jgi:phage-related protein